MKDKHGNTEQQDASLTGREVIYRNGAINPLDVQRAADALLRQGTKPSVAALREQLGGGSPNTLTPMLARYWETLGKRLVMGPESLERVPESLARVTELLWRRAVEEARARLKILQSPSTSNDDVTALQEQVLKLSVALAEANAREGEQLTHLAAMSKERETFRSERATLLALLKSTQALLDQQNARLNAMGKQRSKAVPRRRRLATAGAAAKRQAVSRVKTIPKKTAKKKVGRKPR